MCCWLDTVHKAFGESKIAPLVSDEGRQWPPAFDECLRMTTVIMDVMGKQRQYRMCDK